MWHPVPQTLGAAECRRRRDSTQKSRSLSRVWEGARWEGRGWGAWGLRSAQWLSPAGVFWACAPSPEAGLSTIS